MSNLPSNVRFIRKNGRIIPIRISDGARKAGASAYENASKFTGRTVNTGSRVAEAARGVGRAAKAIFSKKGLMRAAGYGGLAAGAYGVKKAWDKSNEVGKGAIIGAGVGAGISALNFRNMAKNPNMRNVINVWARNRPSRVAALAVAPVAAYALMGAAAGVDVKNGRRILAERKELERFRKKAKKK